jgi:hypothetical protein
MKARTVFTLILCWFPFSAAADWSLVGNNPIPAGDGAVAHDLATDGVNPTVAFVADVGGVRDVRVAENKGPPDWSFLGPSPSEGASFVPDAVALGFVGTTAHVLYATSGTPSVHLKERVGSSWTEIGAPGYASACAVPLALRLAFDGATPHIATLGAGGCGLGIDYAFWNGASWQQRPSVTIFPGQLTFNANGRPDIVFTDQAYVGVPEIEGGGTARIAVRFWDTGASLWVDLVGPLQENATNGLGDEDVALASDTAGNLYAAWAEEVAAGSKVIFVKRYDVVQQTWSLLGTGPASGPGNATSPSLTLINGIPWLAYLEATGVADLVYVRRFESAGNAWQLVGMPLNQSSVVDAFGPVITGIGSEPYVAFREGVVATAQDLYVVRFESPSLVPALDPMSLLILTMLLIATALMALRRPVW